MYSTVWNSKNKRCPPTKHGLLNELHAKPINLIATTQLNSNHTHCSVNENSHIGNHKVTTTKYIVCNCLPLKQKFKVPNLGNYVDRVRGNKNLIEKKKIQNKTISFL